jgi:acyl-CoA thioesterase I
MNPIALSLTDGSTFFLGLVLVFAAGTLLLRCRGARTRSILNVLAAVGAILVIASSTPLPVWAYLGWTASVAGAVVLLNRSVSSKKSRLVACSVLVVLTTALFAVEARYHRLSRITVSDDTVVYVLGDSISAGLGADIRCWPEVLASMTPFRVVNLAQAGATVAGAVEQAEGVTAPHSLVIVEIGGNDLLGDTDALSFHRDLNTLISSLSSGGHEVLLIELPLLPFQNAFGRAQREIAAEYDAVMLPKRYFTKVLGTENGTSDGLHLSQVGHEAMARTIARVIVEQ